MKEENHLLLNEIERLKKDVSCLNIDVKEFKTSMTEKNKAIQEYQNMEIKEKIRQSKVVHKFDDMENNLEFLLKIIGEDFKEFENAYTFFELLVYALSSTKGLDIIEKYLSESKFLRTMIEEFYTKKNLKIHSEKYELAKLFNALTLYVENVFSDKIELEITLNENVPKSLVIDTPKVQSVLYHLIGDIYTFSRHDHPLRLEVIYTERILEFKLMGDIDSNDNSLLSNFFGYSKINDKSRIGLVSAQKIIHILGGELNIVNTETLYQYQLKIPAKVLALTFT